MRLFIAVAADEEVKAAAAGMVARLRGTPNGYRWVDPRDMHVTLRFLGETPEAELPEVEARMRRAAAASASFEIVYGGVGAFDSLDDPRVVWIGLEEGLEPLGRIADLLGRDEPRPFSPHLTLGRARRARSFLAPSRRPDQPLRQPSRAVRARLRDSPRGEPGRRRPGLIRLSPARAIA
jgi:2'-5' RNA ligase